MPARRHVVLGSSGFIGRHVALALRRRGDAVLVVDRNPPRPCPAGITDPPSLIADMRDTDPADIIRDGDIVHHYVWSTIPKTANDDPLADLDANLRLTVRILAAVARRRGTTLLFASSGGTVYGKLRVVPAKENHPLEPITAYGVAKLAAEKYIGFYRAAHGLDARIARIANPFGAGQDPGRRQGAASAFVRRALAGGQIEIWGDGEVVRDYLHISDLARGLLALADAASENLGKSPVFNIGSGRGVSVNTLLDLIGARLRRPLCVVRGAPRSFDVPVNVLDITRAWRRLGWRPRLDLAEGLDLTIGDYRAGTVWYSSLPSRKKDASRAAA